MLKVDEKKTKKKAVASKSLKVTAKEKSPVERQKKAGTAETRASAAAAAAAAAAKVAEQKKADTAENRASTTATKVAEKKKTSKPAEPQEEKKTSKAKEPLYCRRLWRQLWNKLLLRNPRLTRWRAPRSRSRREEDDPKICDCCVSWDEWHKGNCAEGEWQEAAEGKRHEAKGF